MAFWQSRKWKGPHRAFANATRGHARGAHGHGALLLAGAGLGEEFVKPKRIGGTLLFKLYRPTSSSSAAAAAFRAREAAISRAISRLEARRLAHTLHC